MQNINWYPGHMKKTRELIQENLKMVDAVIEVIDARIPVSSRNPIIDELVKSKPRIIVLNKSDLADEAANKAWLAHFRAQGVTAVMTNCNRGDGIKQLLRYFIIVDKVKAGEANGLFIPFFVVCVVDKTGYSANDLIVLYRKKKLGFTERVSGVFLAGESLRFVVREKRNEIFVLFIKLIRKEDPFL